MTGGGVKHQRVHAVMTAFLAKLPHLFMRGNVPNMPNLWLAAGVGMLAGSENIIRNMVHVVETLVLDGGGRA